MVVDATITLGTMLEITVLIVGGIFAMATVKTTVGTMREDITDMKEEIKKVGDVLIKMAVHDQRLSNVEQDVRDLRHGRGFVIPRSDGGINGEYP